MAKIAMREVTGQSTDYWGLVAILGVLILTGLGSAYYMEHSGHWVTGMNNQIVWGLPHVFAVFLIVAASGALNVASISSAFGKTTYKPMAPLSALLAVALLIGGLAVLVLDLGRPDRLIVAMTSYNFKSIFAWNIYLYTGFMIIVIAYIWTMLERKMNPYAKGVGMLAFIWRLILTTGTGSIFGFLVARQAYDAAVMAPMFIALSLSYGTAIYMLVLMAACQWTGRPLGDFVLFKLRNLLGVFAAAQHVTNLYATEHHGVEAFILLSGGIYTAVFWVGQVLIGALLPMSLLFHPGTRTSRQALVMAALMIVLGGLAQMYVTIVSGQAYLLILFPGMEVSSAFYDGVTSGYVPSFYEIGLGLSGFAIALLLVTLAVKFLRFLPETLADGAANPHHSTGA